MAETRKLGRPSFSPTRKEAFRKDSNMSKKMFRDKKRKERDEALSTVVPPTAPRYKHIRISTATFWRWRSLAQELGLDGDEQMASFLLNTYYERAVEAASKEQRQDIPQNSEESRQKVETSMFQGDAEGTETDAMGSTCTTMPIQATQDGSIGLHLTEHPPDSMKEQSEDGGEMLEGEFTCLVKTEPHESGEESNEHGTLPSFSQQGDGLTGDDDDDRNEIEEVEFKCLIKEEPDDGERNQPSCSKQGGNSSKQSSCQEIGNTQIMSGDTSHDRSHGKHLPGDYPLPAVLGTPSHSSPRGHRSSEYGSYLLPNQVDYPQRQNATDSATMSDRKRLDGGIVVENENYDTYSLQNTIRSFPVETSIQSTSCINPEGENTFLCSICSKEFNRKHNLRRHMKFHEGKRPHACSFCNKTFVQKGDLRRHERSHTGERPYSCCFCDKRFIDTSHLKAHLLIHTGEKPYECSLCNKTFSHKASLTVHLRLHSGEKPFKCSLCDNSFSSKSQLMNHQIKHTGEKPYQCSVCEKRVGTKSSLSQHMKIHSGEKPFQCSVCSKCFQRKSTLKKHMKIHGISCEDL
nr:zinc finger protein 525-like isoform X1 [Lytechinus pictus]